MSNMPRVTRRSKRTVSQMETANNNTIEPPNKIIIQEASKKDDSSSESDIENYLQPIDKLDLNSSFFNVETNKENQGSSFDDIENQIFAGVSRLDESNSESDTEIETTKTSQELKTVTKLQFERLHEHTKQMEEARRHVEEYNAAKRGAATEKDDIFKMLVSVETSQQQINSSEFESCSSDSERENWEEVESQAVETATTTTKNENLEITVELPGIVKKKKTADDKLMALKRRLNRIRKENQLLIHKVHLLSWIAHGNFINSVINDERVLSLCLSLVPSEKAYPSGRTDLTYLEQIVKWYKKAVKLATKENYDISNSYTSIEKQISKKAACNKKMLVYIFIGILRALGIQARLVLSFQVESLRPPTSELHSLSAKPPDDSKKTTVTKKKAAGGDAPNISPTPGTSKDASSSQFIKNSKKTVKIPSKDKNTTKLSKSKSGETNKNSKSVVDKKPGTPPKNNKKLNFSKLKNAKSSSQSKTPKKVTKKNDKSISQLDGALHSSSSSDWETDLESITNLNFFSSSDSDDDIVIPQVDGANGTPTATSSKRKPRVTKEKEQTPRQVTQSNRKPIIKYKDTDSEDEFISSPLKSTSSSKNIKPSGSSSSSNIRNARSNVTECVVKLVKARIKEQKAIDRSKKVKRKKPIRHDTESDSDGVPEPIRKKIHDSGDEFIPKTKVKQRVQVKKSRKVLSSDEEDGSKITVVRKKGVDVWAEVFLESEERWISVDVVQGQIHCVREIYTRASHPVSYVVAWNNNNGIKDISARYCQNFNTVTRKLRIDSKWWKESLKPFIGKQTAKDLEEDEDLERQQLDQPLPASITEYKNHPLYVLKRHLLKFEAIYPPDIPPVGFVRKEAVYPRQCVYTLHSRDIWLKHAKVVKLGEQPYKIVKARPKYDKLSNTVITDQLLEIFGPWQTEDYVPPTAENGQVPRNAFGNVELFKMCMLPKKTVHLQLPGLNKVARKLNIDCAPAVVGFDFHSGWSHPTFDGFVVCEEYAETLIKAWEEYQEETERREREKIEKRVYDNWKRLIKGLLIRERLKAKYNFGAPSTSEEKGKKKLKGPRFATKK